MCCVSSPSPSDSLDLDSAIPGTWALLLALFGAHVGTGLYEWWCGFESLTDALVMGRDLRFRAAAGGQHSDLIWKGEAFRLWTSVFLHTSGLHLVLNAVAVYGLGRVLEPWIGARRIVAWFVLGGVLASVMSWLGPPVLSDGASGGAFTLLGVLAVLGSERRSRMDARDAQLLGPWLWAMIGVNLILSFAVPALDEVAHLTGLIVGIVLGGLLGKREPWPLRVFEQLLWISVAFMAYWCWGIEA